MNVQGIGLQQLRLGRVIGVVAAGQLIRLELVARLLWLLRWLVKKLRCGHPGLGLVLIFGESRVLRRRPPAQVLLRHGEVRVPRLEGLDEEIQVGRADVGR